MIESEAEKLSLDNQILLSLIQEDFPIEFKDAIPLGTIEFTENYFKIFYEIEKENPIEIPPILRTYEFLKRRYSITSYVELLPLTF